LPGPTKKERKITVTAIRNIYCEFQPASALQDEWKIFQADDDVSAKDTKKLWKIIGILGSTEVCRWNQSLSIPITYYMVNKGGDGLG